MWVNGEGDIMFIFFWKDLDILGENILFDDLVVLVMLDKIIIGCM